MTADLLYRARRVHQDLGSLTVVSRGLVAGDVVIAQPTDAITDGTRIRG